MRMRMDQRPWVCGAVLGLAMCVAGCATQPPLHVTAGEVKQPVALEKGQDLYVSLKSNRSTGYSWQWAEKPDARVTLLGDPAYEQSTDMPGAGGVETFHFRAKSVGTQQLRFLYRRPWEKGEHPIDVQVVPIIVQ